MALRVWNSLFFCKRSVAPHFRTIGPADVHKYAAPVRLSKSAALLNVYSPAVFVAL